MKRWEDALTEAEQQAVVAEALHRTKRNVTHAAVLLGVSRRHLSRYIAVTRRLAETHSLPDPFGLGGLDVTTETSSLSETSQGNIGSENKNGLNASETLSIENSLTYGLGASTFSHVGSVAAVASDPVTLTPKTDAEEEAAKVPITVELPKPLADWIELQALREKQSGARSRMAKAPIIVRAIEYYRRMVEGKTNE